MNDIFEKAKFEGREVKLDSGKASVGDDVNLTAKEPALKNVLVGAGWDLNAFDADNLDLDISILLLDGKQQTRVDEDFVFYNNLETCEGAVKHHGDSRTGAGDGDDESISINLQGVPFDIMHIYFVLSIYKGEEKGQNLGMVRNAYIRVTNAENRHELVRFELDDELSDKQETAVVVGTLNREGPKWHFKPMNDFVEGGLGAVAKRHGMLIQNQ